MTIPIACGGIGGLTAAPNFAQNVLKTSTVTVPHRQRHQPAFTPAATSRVGAVCF